MGLWPSLLHVLPEFVRQVEIYQLSNSSPDADLILVERHTIESVEPPASAATGDRFCLLLWNRLVSPHYDLLIPLTSSSRCRNGRPPSAIAAIAAKTPKR